jgi:uncharacterized tellurite resistance protein B-like protein
MSQIMRSLRALILLVLIGMFLLIVGKPLADVVKTMPAFEAASNYLDAAISASIALTVTYITLRMLQIVKSDHQLAELQADVIIRAVERKQAEQFQNLEKKGGPTPYKPPEDFGRLIQ